ncbi:MAG: glycosyltransferase family 2 protein [Flavobacteriales bacterium]|mgnify:CR=1 FL=1|nr:glycosyltransferase family 2 protein [Flavobacteriales bacterium]MBK6944559.1 glycosyltransferase family 2 protein [Flavobacteriales bacterium]MBK7241291.1 glycosyltransferase family 2 protein [Flavobacteriales bacterium]MBK7295540.1 glycosyltransferase family 2 protein [Flavobacteriales bacterium]MBK9534214.1 glycosyltransferase family 2 protein [Flavobacteriales bacterium]
MTASSIIDVIIPAFNEEEAVALVVGDIPKDLVRHIVVVNNASSDRTSEEARKAGAIVMDQPLRGYGNACLKGIEKVATHQPPPDIVVFIDADHSDRPQQMTEVVAPIVMNDADFVIGSRALGHREDGSMMPQQVFGNWLATRLLKLFYGVRYTDLGPFRAIRWQALQNMHMQDRTFGWTVEMQLKAAKQNLRIIEVPVDYRKRIGFSKISGTVKGSILAGYKIIVTIFKYR